MTHLRSFLHYDLWPWNFIFMVHSIINIKRTVLNIMPKAAPKKHEYGFSRTRVEF